MIPYLIFSFTLLSKLSVGKEQKRNKILALLKYSGSCLTLGQGERMENISPYKAVANLTGVISIKTIFLLKRSSTATRDLQKRVSFFFESLEKILANFSEGPIVHSLC